MSFATEHATALEDLRANGAAVTFTRTRQAQDASTGAMTATVTTVTGYAMRVRGEADRYRQLGLIESSSPTLLFAASSYGDLPSEGDVVTWAGDVHTVRDVNPVAPDGNAIIARLMVTR